MKTVAHTEQYPVHTLASDVRKGHTVIVKSAKRDCTPLGIGKNLSIKINANIGTSAFSCDTKKEIEKLSLAVKYGADTVMDLSTGGDTHAMRALVLASSKVPVGTVPVYDVMLSNPDVGSVTEDDFLRSIERHIEDGVDFITVHCGVRERLIHLIKSRIMGIVSRGGSFLAKWMLHHKKENPLFTYYDDVLSMAKKYDVTLSLGDGLRPGCLADATDTAQLAELVTLGKLAAKARKRGVQVMIEGPGHVPLHQIGRNVRFAKKYCHGAPFYVLGPLVTDASPGYDHLTGAIGGALAGWYGADFLCYLTPTEHLGLPDTEHVIEGVIASKIAAHAADIARGIPHARERDDRMSVARSSLDWEGMYACAFNPDKARAIRNRTKEEGTDVCSMCGELCSAKLNKELRKAY
jgi:phosphomethylpyrimidine synthase